jgi:hypothetical protein
MSFYLKDPRSRVEYAILWPAGFLDGQAIAQSQWSVVPDEAHGAAVEAALVDGAQTVGMISGGIAGHVYSVSNQVILADGRRDVRSITLRAEAR